jgi:hypothetical protein
VAQKLLEREQLLLLLEDANVSRYPLKLKKQVTFMKPGYEPPQRMADGVSSLLSGFSQTYSRTIRQANSRT